MIINLTQSLVDRELCASQNQTRMEYVDEGRLGLYLECRTSNPNEGTYYLRVKDRRTGKTRHYRIAKSVEISLAEARRRAQELKESLLLGSGSLNHQQRTVLSYDAFMQGYYFPSKQAKRTLNKDEQLYRIKLKEEFGHQPIGSITRQQVHAFQLKLTRTNLATSSQNHYLRLLRHSLNIALDLELIGRNPAGRLKLAAEHNIVENYLSEEQVRRLLGVLDRYENPVVAAIVRLLLATGARRGEALRAKWRDIKIEQRLWIIPAENSKSKKVGSIPLSDIALKALESLPRYDHTDDIFINPLTNQRYVDIKKGWTEIKKRAEIPAHTRLHDLRHTFASLLINRGRSLYEVQRILRHSDPKVTTRYSHLTAETLRNAVTEALEVG